MSADNDNRYLAETVNTRARQIVDRFEKRLTKKSDPLTQEQRESLVYNRVLKLANRHMAMLPQTGDETAELSADVQNIQRNNPNIPIRNRLHTRSAKPKAFHRL